MKIHYALMSCDENPLYIDFIPVITKAWNKLGVKPVFVIVGSEEKEWELKHGAYLYYFKSIDGISLPFQALNARIWAWKQLYYNIRTWNTPSINAILSDIDMMPLSSNYFNGTADRYQEHEIVSYCDDAIIKFGQIASCYILANSKVMSELIVENSWEEFIKNRAEETGQGWGGDQWYLGEILKKHPNTIRLNRGWGEDGSANNRLDRINWHFNDYDVKEGRLYDAHCLRPYKQHKVEIDRLYNLIP